MPEALRIGLDWQNFHTPPYAGGLTDQPMRLLREVRVAINAYNAVSAWRNAQHQLGGEALAKFYSMNSDLVEFMDYVWSLQDNATDG